MGACSHGGGSGGSGDSGGGDNGEGGGSGTNGESVAEVVGWTGASQGEPFPSEISLMKWGRALHSWSLRLQMSNVFACCRI